MLGGIKIFTAWLPKYPLTRERLLTAVSVPFASASLIPDALVFSSGAPALDASAPDFGEGCITPCMMSFKFGSCADALPAMTAPTRTIHARFIVLSL